MITHQLWAWKIPCVVVSPSQLKTYALGKGSGKGTDKDWVLAAVVRRYLEVAIAGNDEADALVLAAMAADHYGHPVVTVPETHRRALATVSWPDLEA
jgi:crossover junction endodeoxyribonuclease RuvC